MKHKKNVIFIWLSRQQQRLEKMCGAWSCYIAIIIIILSLSIVRSATKIGENVWSMEKGAAPFENNLEGGAFQVIWMILRIFYDYGGTGDSDVDNDDG